jgi:signal transduction histidine kinase
MTALIDSTLSASKLEAGSIRFSPQKVDIASLIRECCDAQQDLSREHNILLELDPLPETISADPLLLTQIFTNLLSNAVKYSPDNPDILVTGKAVDGQVVINVADQGLGIPDDEMDKLFTRFFRARTSTGIAGTGVGLNVVKEFCEMHGGKVTVTSQEGRGTTFRVTLPAAATQAQAPSGPEARPMPDDAALTPNLARQAD